MLFLHFDLLHNVLELFNLYWTFVKVKYEAGTTKWTVRGLEKYGHDTEPYHLGESIVQVCVV